MTLIEGGLTLYFDVQLCIKEYETRIFYRVAISEGIIAKYYMYHLVILNIFNPSNCIDLQLIADEPQLQISKMISVKKVSS
jgi:hypothetical protein